jgi:hypothetical protein
MTGAKASKTAAVALPPVTPVKVSTGKPLTRSQLIAEANAICARTNAELSAITLVTRKEVERELPQETIYRTTEANELSKLVPPASMAREWSTVVNDFHTYAAYAQAAVPYARARNLRAFVPLLRPAARVQERLQSDAAHIGIGHCAKAE